MLKDKARLIVEYILRHSKILFPIGVIAAVAITVSVALNASNADKLAEESSSVPESSTEETVVEEAEKESPMVANEDPAIAQLVATFYDATASGDAETFHSVCDEISVQDMLGYQERAKYIENYPVIEIYTKPGPEEGSTIAFVYYKVIFTGHEEQFPGYTALYICTNEQGELYIRKGENSEEVNQYIGDVLAQDDVVDFNNRVNEEYNVLIEEHPELLEYLSEMNEQVKAAVGTELAQLNGEQTQDTEGTEGETQVAEGGEGAAEGAEQTEAEQPAENTVQYATATTTVNVRSSDSEQADKLGKVSGGTRLQVLEQKVNGWSKVLYEGKEGYIKSEYLEVAESAEGLESIGNVTATTNINVRASASETAERLGVLAGGESVELLANENGWCKIKYNGQVGYVKADYVE